MLILRGRLVSAALPLPCAVIAAFSSGGTGEGQPVGWASRQLRLWRGQAGCGKRPGGCQRGRETSRRLGHARSAPLHTVAQRAGVHQLVRVNARDGRSRDVAHVVHPRLQAGQGGGSRRGTVSGGTVGARERHAGALQSGSLGGQLVLAVAWREQLHDQARPMLGPPGRLPPSQGQEALTMKEVRPRCCSPSMMRSASSSCTPRSCTAGRREALLVRRWWGDRAWVHCMVRLELGAASPERLTGRACLPPYSEPVSERTPPARPYTHPTWMLARVVMSAQPSAP